MNKDLYEISYELKKNVRKKVFSIVMFIILLILIINLILQFVIFPVRQKSVSMEPDIPVSSCIMFSPLIKKINRGSVVLVKPQSDEKLSFLQKVFDSFVMFFTARQVKPSNIDRWMGNEYQIRRVIGIPGDTIYMRDYVLYIKPEGENYYLTEFELIDSSYNINITASPAFWDNEIGVKGSFEEKVLGKDEYFVFGDNRNSCVDSRFWGALTHDDIEALAFIEYFPFNKIKFFH